MTIPSAINQAKAIGEWCMSNNPPTYASVLFLNNKCEEDETELDLYSNDIESELAELWASICNEMSSNEESVIAVCAY